MKNTHTKVLTLLLWGAFQVLSIAQNIVPQLDNSFNNSGKHVLNNFESFEPLDMKTQPDGKVVVGGYGSVDGVEPLDGFIYRLNQDGTLDESFGGEGFVVLNIDGGHDALQGFEVLPDHKILILLESAFRTILIRLMPDGSYDTSFGIEGLLLVPTADYELATDILIQSDGKIIILADKTVASGRFIGTVRRCNPDGSLDESYGNAGSVELAIDLSQDFVRPSGVFQTDGKLLITAYFGSGAGSGFPVIRLNTDGSFDTSFSGDGIYIKALGTATNDAHAECIAVAPNGKIYVGGFAPTVTDISMTVLSLNSNGGTNGSFGTFGLARIPFTLYASARSLLIQPDGKILVGGYTYQNPPTATQLAFTRLNTTGLVDQSFGNQQGRFVTTVNNNDAVQIASELELAPDGRLVVSVWLNETLPTQNSPSSACVLRYLTDITVKAEEPSLVFQGVNVAPNPMTDEAVTLTYTLEKDCEVSVQLYDVSGKEISRLIAPSQRKAGVNTQQFYLPANTAPGVYFLLITNGLEQKVVRVVRG